MTLALLWTRAIRNMGRASRTLVAPLALVVGVALVLVPAAAASQPSWHLTTETVPTNLPPGGEGRLILVATNLGDAPIDGSGGDPVILSDLLPPDVTATGITSSAENGTPVECALATLTCTFSGVIYPYEQMAVGLKVKVGGEPQGGPTTK